MTALKAAAQLIHFLTCCITCIGPTLSCNLGVECEIILRAIQDRIHQRPRMMKMVQILRLGLLKGKNNLSYVEQTNLGN
jgi:hypothetical protein